MKKIFFACLTAGIMLFSAANVFAGNTLSVQLDGQSVAFNGQQPVIVDGRTLIPLRGVFEKMGYNVSWEANTKTAVLESGSSEVRVTANSSTFDVNGTPTGLDVPAQIMNGSMMLPLRAIGEAAGAKVSWDAPTKTVIIDTSSLNADDVVKASDYQLAYTKAVSPVDSISKLFDEFNSLDGDISAEALAEYRSRLFEANNTVLSVKSAVMALNVPESMQELHAVRLEALDKLSETISVLIDYCDGNMSDSDVDTKTNEIAAQVDDIYKRNSRILEGIELK